MKRLIALIAVCWCAQAAHSAEIEKTPIPAPSPVAPGAPFSGVNAQLDAALAPGARLETASESLVGASTILQGGQAGPAAAADAVDARIATAQPAVPLAPATTQAASPRKAVPSVRADKREKGERLFAVAGVAVILATLLAYAAFIGGFARLVQDMETDLQQQIRQADDWGR